MYSLVPYFVGKQQFLNFVLSLNHEVSCQPLLSEYLRLECYMELISAKETGEDVFTLPHSPPK